MKNTYKALLSIVMTGGALLLLAVLPASAQMKIGNHPTQIGKASILELESSNQGLRLTRVPDTASVNLVFATMTAPEVDSANGMIVFQTKDSALYLRAKGYWHRMMDVSEGLNNFWNLTGNAGTDTSQNFLGTTDGVSLKIGTNNSARIIITPSGLVRIVDSLEALHAQIDTVAINDSLNVANILLVNKDSAHINNTLYIQDSVVIRSLRSVTGDTAVLTIDPSGIVHKMSIDSLLSKGIRSINGIAGGPNFHIKMDSLVVTGHTGPWIDSISGAGDTALIIHMPVATTTVQGIMNTSTQAFGGTKSFRDSVAIGTTGTPNSILDVEGSVSMKTVYQNSGTSYDMTSTGDPKIRTIVIDVTSIGSEFTITLPNAANIDGRMYTIKKVGSATDAQIDRDVKIMPSSSQTFEDGGLSFYIYNNFTSVTLQAKNSKWYIVGH